MPTLSKRSPTHPTLPFPLWPLTWPSLLVENSSTAKGRRRYTYLQIFWFLYTMVHLKKYSMFVHNDRKLMELYILFMDEITCPYDGQSYCLSCIRRIITESSSSLLLRMSIMPSIYMTEYMKMIMS